MDYEENRKELANRMVEIEFHPVETELAVRNESDVMLPVKTLAEYGGAAASAMPALQEIMRTAKTLKGAGAGAGENGQLFKCVFPNGVSGTLAQAKDGSGALGTILDNSGIAGQARWIPVAGLAGGAGVAAIAPAVIFVAAMAVQMNKKLDHLQKTADEILGFLELDKQAHMKADLKILSEIMSNYKLNWNNESFVHAKLVQVGDIKHAALANIDFYKARARSKAESKELIHFNFAPNKVNDVQNLFASYRSAVYLYSYASFAETMLMGDYRRATVKKVVKSLEDCELRYQEFYNTCHGMLCDSAKSALDHLAVQGVANAAGFLGGVIGSIPVVRQGPVDEALEGASDFLKGASKDAVNKMLGDFRQNEITDANVFSDNVRLIDSYFNKPVALITDGEQILIECEQEATSAGCEQGEGGSADEQCDEGDGESQAIAECEAEAGDSPQSENALLEGLTSAGEAVAGGAAAAGKVAIGGATIAAKNAAHAGAAFAAGAQQVGSAAVDAAAKAGAAAAEGAAQVGSAIADGAANIGKFFGSFGRR